mmetsp:Transcript_31663/g.97893  ORF Transcript_31663/g.97893 Transcript_31663/m.97893 type:complete len:257 (+) Transcript_31663:179-949(+)
MPCALARSRRALADKAPSSASVLAAGGAAALLLVAAACGAGFGSAAGLAAGFGAADAPVGGGERCCCCCCCCWYGCCCGDEPPLLPSGKAPGAFGAACWNIASICGGTRPVPILAARLMYPGYTSGTPPAGSTKRFDSSPTKASAKWLQLRSIRLYEPHVQPPRFASPSSCDTLCTCDSVTFFGRLPTWCERWNCGAGRIALGGCWNTPGRSGLDASPPKANSAPATSTPEWKTPRPIRAPLMAACGPGIRWYTLT